MAAPRRERAPQRPGSSLVSNRRVSRAVLAGRHGMQTGVWFHVTTFERAGTLRREGIRRCGDVDDAAQASWVDPDVVYVWPTEDAARDWVAFRRDNGYGGRSYHRYEVVAVNARPDECVVSPDNEDFGGLVGAWAGERYSSEPWPSSDELDSAEFYRSLLDVAGDDGVTLGAWLDEHGDSAYWDFDEDADESEQTDDRVAASRMLRVMPDGLRRALAERYAQEGRAVMLFTAIPASRVCELDD